MENQQEIWDNIAREWNEFKNNPDPNVIEFLENAKENENILDLGCASGRFFTKTLAKIYAIDFSEEMLKHAGKKAEKLDIKTALIEHDLTKDLPFKENFFDKTICIAALHCIKGKENRQKLLKEIKRVLKPSGKAIIKVWNKKSSRFKNKQKETFIKWRDKGERYYYLYDAEELEQEIKKSGLKIINLESKNSEGFERQEIWVEVTE